MRPLQKLARGQPCLVRIPGVCNGNPETTVLAHIRRQNVGGMGLKPPDLIGAWACSDCHDVIDGRQKSPYNSTDIARFEAEGLVRTLYEVDRLVTVKVN